MMDIVDELSISARNSAASPATPNPAAPAIALAEAQSIGYDASSITRTLFNDLRRSPMPMDRPDSKENTVRPRFLRNSSPADWGVPSPRLVSREDVMKPPTT